MSRVVHEPPTKRKTLIERAAEPINPPRSHVPQPKSSAFGKQPNMGVFMNSTTTYRNTSNTSTASSTSSIRPPSRQNGLRPTAEDEEMDSGVMGKRKGTPILSFNSIGITFRKTRSSPDKPSSNQSISLSKDVRSQQSGSSPRSASNSSNGKNDPNSATSFQQGGVTRQPSLVSAFAELSITPSRASRKTSAPKSSTKHRPSLSPVKEFTSPSKIPKFSCTPSLRHSQSSQALMQTPSAKYSISGLRTPAPSPSKRVANAGAKEDKDEGLPVYLTKDALTPVSLPAWDTKGRLDDMERTYMNLRTEFAAVAESKTAIQLSMDVYKARGASTRQQECVE